ncbi:MAG: carboxymuconolactone decarboxylase family protein [Lautropia sp.]
MARIPLIEREQLPARDQDLIARPINLLKALANHPSAMRAFSGPAAWIRSESTLAARLRELVILQIGHVTGSAYEFSHHIKISRAFGVTPDDVQAVIDETAGRPTRFEPVEVAALAAARDLTLRCTLSDASWTRLEALLGREQAIELVLIIGYYNYLARVIAGFAIDVEPEYAALLEPYRSSGGPS